MDEDNKSKGHYVSDAPISSVSIRVSTPGIYRTIEDKKRDENVMLSFGDVVSSAIARALPDYHELTGGSGVNLGYLVNISKGVKTVVLKDADKISVVELSRGFKEKILEYLHNELDETEKSSIIVNNLSPFNAFYVTPPIYSGTVATIALCSEFPTVEMKEERQAIVNKFNLVLSFDARIINCQRALEFLNDIKNDLEGTK